MDIRRAQTHDFLAIAALDREAWQDNRHPSFIPDGEHVWRVWVEHALVYAAFDAHTVVGAILAFPCLNNDYCLHKVFVRREQRGRGLAKALFQALLQESDRRGLSLFLTVDPANAPAVKLYETFGFSERQFVPRYYRPEEDRLILRRPGPPAPT